jgi:hypothetical protein
LIHLEDSYIIYICYNRKNKWISFVYIVYIMAKNQWSPVPPPALNGGLFTGEAFEKDAPWGNVPVRPTTAYMTNMNLRSANPPIQALFQMQAGFRPGNNSDDMMPGLVAFTGSQEFGPFNFACIPCFKPNAPAQKEPPCSRVIQIP